MRELKSERIKEAVRHLAAEFLSERSNRTSLITVTGVDLSSRGEKAVVRITVLPETREKAGLDFANRNSGALRKFIGERVSLRRLPFLSFAVDIGEKNREKLQQLSAESMLSNS